jgi:hypothetical protein
MRPGGLATGVDSALPARFLDHSASLPILPLKHPDETCFTLAQVANLSSTA